MDYYESEKEQLEAIKSWWKDNGRVVVVGLVLGLGGIFGWTTWQGYAKAQAEKASITYEQLVNWASAQDYERADELAEVLMRDYPNSAYAALGSLIRANSAVAQGRLDEARGYLRWTLDNARQPALKHLATLRLARLAYDQADFEGALALLDAGGPGTLGAAFEEARGDIMAAQRRVDEAQRHYRQAMDDPRLSPTSRERLSMKLDDLGVSVAAQEQP